MKDIVALCKRRGFIFQASDIYGGINGFWDYGPLGTELKNNIRDLWWNAMVKCPPIGPDGNPVRIVGLDSAIIQNPEVWVASGHVGGFADPMTDCRETKKRYRADHLVVFIAKDGSLPWLAVQAGDDQLDLLAARIKKFAKGKAVTDYDATPFDKIALADIPNIVAPEASKAASLTEPKAFNLLFETHTGPIQSDDNKAYLRGETAQGIFINYKNIIDSSRVRVPFGIAQIGKAFRNEVNPRNFIFRSREFEQMEMEWFCHPDDADMWFDFWMEERKKWWLSIGVGGDDIIFRKHEADELVFYSKKTFDVEYRFPFTSPGFGELEGIAYRTNYDLGQHEKFSKVKMEYMDPMDNTKRYVPHVIEPAAGLTRGVLAVLCEAYTIDPNRPAGMYMNFHPNVAPIKAAILPLTEKDGQPEIAQKLYMDLRQDFMVELDVKQNIGKRYARQDEIGTPFCFTVDTETATDNCVTVRHRNTMKQERVAISNVKTYLRENMAKMA
ncbi:MAG: glycine--tRNA ligase [Alphaproteobacteria bacterium RIFCSPHIGHO2_12_FULL_45_9]|nr:MAG: glycine--tRNA ligase [Alphaproteobacteria bacterium RIFCSPHIGHO2_02_FULL_46_13]OFW98206.1 MAG: glycine--tRNA ligase [Alphaproteobacteria bacterium RIFCSPHIGHO2_12_FULL_45_9]